jgi:hypothetical protein
MEYINLSEQLLKRWDTKDCPQEYLDIASGKTRGYRPTFFNVPIECCIVIPKIVFPIQGRMWETEKFAVRGNIIDYYILLKEINFRGTSAYPKVYLTELWDDYGDDGHTDYGLCGYGLTSNPEKIKKYYSQLYV